MSDDANIIVPGELAARRARSRSRGTPDAPPPYAELAAASNFSFLRGASTGADLVTTALFAGHAGIGIADRNTVTGVVRAYKALKTWRDDGMPPMTRVREGGSPGEHAWVDGTSVGLPDFQPEEVKKRAAAFQLVVGARLVFSDDTPDIVVYPENRAGWGRLCRLLTTGNRRAKKGQCELHLEDLIADTRNLLLILISERPHKALAETAMKLRDAAPGATWIGATMHGRGDDQRNLAKLKAIAAKTGLPLLALNDVLYTQEKDRDLQDVLTCIREKTTIDRAGRLLQANAERHLKDPKEMARLFRYAPEAIDEIQHVLARADFTLDQLKYEYPDEPVPPGWDAQDWLEELVRRRAPMRYPDGVPEKVVRLLAHELALIKQLQYARYFLTIRDIVEFADAKGILCQGRGSAANSAVCYVLGITAIDPAVHDVLFSRFISSERQEPPDIDVDFEHERREEVIQHIYKKYGLHRAGIAGTVISYRPRSAIRDVGKALGLTEDVTARIAGTQWGSWGNDIPESQVRQAGLDPDNPQIKRAVMMAQRLLGFPRHLSQHVGGFVLARDRLDELVPIGNAAMEKRTFIEWDKDDIDTLQLMKVDVLALGMLTCIRKAFDLMRTHCRQADFTLATLPDDQEDVYAMLCNGDSIGVFQVESRAQINMLPRLRPKEFYDLVIQVAIVRPGPIQGDMVHPYLRRRSGEEKVVYPSPALPHDQKELHGILWRTFGVPLFQEQAMRLAIVAAEFTDEQANGLRRAMATFRNVGTIHLYERLMVDGMVRRGYDPDFARRCFEQIKGFGSYGFPESHAASFAKLVYVSSFIKCRYPAVFACALLNAQPMGFYAPAQIVRDAQQHGVEARAPGVNFSAWDNTLEANGAVPAFPPPFTGEGDHEVVEGGRCSAAAYQQEPPPPPAGAPPPRNGGGGKGRQDSHLALRLGFRQIDGFSEDWAATIIEHRNAGYADAEDLARRTGLPMRALRLLADADAFRSVDTDRRNALWSVRRLPGAQPMPLFASADARELGIEADSQLPAMSLGEHIATDYQTIRLSLKGHPMAMLRPLFNAEAVATCADISAAPDGRVRRVAGVVLVRQRPGNGKAIFVTLEDETGVSNLVLWVPTFERYRREVMSARLMVAEGLVQRSKEDVVHLMARRIFDRTAELDRLSDLERMPVDLSRADEFAHPQIPRGRHPRDVRILPKSRDFH